MSRQSFVLIQLIESIKKDPIKSLARDLKVLALFTSFLVACYATLYPALSVRPSVRRSIGPFVCHTFGFFGFLASLRLPK